MTSRNKTNRAGKIAKYTPSTAASRPRRNRQNATPDDQLETSRSLTIPSFATYPYRTGESCAPDLGRNNRQPGNLHPPTSPDLSRHTLKAAQNAEVVSPDFPSLHGESATVTQTRWNCPAENGTMESCPSSASVPSTKRQEPRDDRRLFGLGPMLHERDFVARPVVGNFVHERPH